MPTSSRSEANLRQRVENHYDSLALLYRAVWGEHIHHGLWVHASDSPRRAQVQLVEYLARRAQVRANERVLDVGCGYGAPARWLVKNFDCSVAGVTISQAQARFSKRSSASGKARFSVLRADAASLPFADAAFGLIWVIECIEHLVDKRQFIQESARLLRPGGRLALCTWQRGTDVPATDRLVRSVCESFLCPSLASAADYAAWCAEAGLELRCLDDLTPQVEATWEVLAQRVGRPWLKPVKRLLRPDVRRFVDGFPTILEAYRSGVMRYGLLVAAAS